MKRFEVGDYVKVFKFFAKVLEIIDDNTFKVCYLDNNSIVVQMNEYFEKVTEAEVIQWRLET